MQFLIAFVASKIVGLASMPSNHIFIYYTMHGHVLSKIFCVELIFSIDIIVIFLSGSTSERISESLWENACSKLLFKLVISVTERTIINVVHNIIYIITKIIYIINNTLL